MDFVNLWYYGDRHGRGLPGARFITGGTFDDPDWIKASVDAWTRSAMQWMVFLHDVEFIETRRA
jgi:hypothetical protein